MNTENDRQIPPLELEPARRRRVLSGIAGRGGYVAVGLAVGVLGAGGGYAVAAATSASSIHGCISKRTGALSVKATCGKGTKALVWNERGPQGARGPQGKAGTTTTIQEAAPAGWTVDTYSSRGLDSSYTSDTHLSQDSSGIASATLVTTGEDQVVAEGCHSGHAPVVVVNADQGAAPSGEYLQATAAAPNPDQPGYDESVEEASPNSQGEETFDIFTYVNDPSAGNSLGNYINDADATNAAYSLLIYC